jgi:hypothetical protein
MSTTSTTTTTTPAPTTLTITTTSTTKFDVNGNSSATIANLATGQKVIVMLAAPVSATGTNTALAVFARSPQQLYAFVGTVSSTPAAGSTSLSVNVTSSLPSGVFTGAQTFTIGPSTLVIGGSAMALGSLSGVAANDVVAGGVIAPAGETAAQVEANPLAVVVDFTSTPTGTMTAAKLKRMKTEALNRAVKMLKAKAKPKAKAKTKAKTKAKSTKKAKSATHKATHHTTTK